MAAFGLSFYSAHGTEGTGRMYAASQKLPDPLTMDPPNAGLWAAEIRLTKRSPKVCSVPTAMGSARQLGCFLTGQVSRLCQLHRFTGQQLTWASRMGAHVSFRTLKGHLTNPVLFSIDTSFKNYLPRELEDTLESLFVSTARKGYLFCSCWKWYSCWKM